MSRQTSRRSHRRRRSSDDSSSPPLPCGIRARALFSAVLWAASCIGSFWLGHLSNLVSEEGALGASLVDRARLNSRDIFTDLLESMDKVDLSKGEHRQQVRSKLVALRAHYYNKRSTPFSVTEADKAVEMILSKAGLGAAALGNASSATTGGGASLAGLGIFPTSNPEAIRKRIKNPKINVDVLAESHHFQYGGAWLKGRDQFDHLVEQGLKPWHKFLELGCGTLRASLWIIEYLEPGNFYCIEANAESLRAGVQYELRLHGLLPKDPQLVWDGNFNLSRVTSPGLDVDFDYAFAFSVFIHICGGCRDNLCARGLLAATKRLKVGGKLIVNKRAFDERTIDVEAFGLATYPLCDHGPAHFTTLPDYYCSYTKKTRGKPTEATWRSGV